MRRSEPAAAVGQREWSRVRLAALIVLLLGVMAGALVFRALPVSVPPLPEPEPLAVAPPPVPAASGARAARFAPPAAPPSLGQPAPAWPSDPARLVRALAPLQREVTEGLAALDRDAGCEWGEMFARLTLATADGEVEVQELELWRRPPPADPDAPDHDPAAFAPREVADPAAAACVRQALEGRWFPAPSARPGRTWQTTYAPGARP